MWLIGEVVRYLRDIIREGMMVVICIPLLVRWYMRLLWYLMIVMIARDRSLMIINMILLSIGPRCILTPINVVINATLVISIIGLTSGQCFVVKNKILCSDYHRSYQSYRFGVMVVVDEVVAVGVVG